MRLGCICGSFNRAFAARQIDQLGFVAHCADVLGVAGVELQDIHCQPTRENRRAEAGGRGARP